MKMIQDESKFKILADLCLAAFLFVMGFGLCAKADSFVHGDISKVGEATHLEFSGRPDWNYDAKKDGDKLTLLIPAVDDKTTLQLSTWNCSFIKSVDINKDGPDGRYEIKFTLTSPDVESFDYLTDDPSNLIFDFYKKDKKTPATPATDTKKTDTASKQPDTKVLPQAPVTNKLPEKVSGNSKKKSEDFQKVERKPAGSELIAMQPAVPTGADKGLSNSADDSQIQFERGVFDGNDPDYDRFLIKDYQVKEEAIISARQGINIPFPMLALKTKRLEEMMKEPPIYEITEDVTAENKEARFLQTLYKNNRPGAFFETYNYFVKKYPHTKYDQIIKNMAAEINYKLYERDHDLKNYNEFRNILDYLVVTYPDSPLTERNHLLLSYANLERGEYVEALKNFQTFTKNFPDSEELDRVRMGMAEAYVGMKKPEEGIKIYSDLRVNAKNKHFAVEAAYRVGDIYYITKDYKQAIDAYSKVQKEFPKYASVFGNAKYNRSEALFLQGDYRNALEGYVDFLKNFPAHEHGGFALTRIGELLQFMGADQRQVMGAFLESYFRYPSSQGAEVARIRMLSQGLKGMKEREKKRAIEEIDKITEKSTLPMFQEFATLLKAEGFSRREEYRNSLDLLLSYYQNHPTTANLSVFRGRILRNISDILRVEVEHKNFIEALNLYGKYSTTWLKNANRIDTEYFEALAYEQGGVSKEAQNIFSKIKNQLKSIAGTKEEKERKVYENLPTLDEVNLRLAAIAVSQRRDQDAFGYLKEIKGNMTMAEEIERVRLNSIVAKNTGDLKRAADYLEVFINKNSSQTANMIQPHLELADLRIKLGQFDNAQKSLDFVGEMKTKGDGVDDESWSKALELRGDLLLAKGEKMAAVDIYTQLLDAYESSRPLSHIRYRTGKVLFDEGDLVGAEKIWNGLNTETGQFYKKLAQEKLEQATWQDSYRKYIQRIPAAEGLK